MASLLDRGQLSVVGMMLLAFVVSISFAHAEPRDFAIPGNEHPDLNASYLSDLTQDPLHTRISTDVIYDRGWGLNVRQQYEDMIRDYNLKQTYGLVSPDDQRMHLDQLNNFYHDQVFTQIEQYQLKQNADKARKIVEKSDTIKKLEKPAAVPAALVATYMGTPFSFNITDNTKFTGRTDFRNQNHQFTVNSPYADSSLVLDNNVSPLPGMIAPGTDPFAHPERMKVALSRSVPVLDIGSGVTYGNTSSTVTASISKVVAPHTTCFWDSVHPLSPDSSDVKELEERVRVTYGINF